MNRTFWKRYVGDRAFYHGLFLLIFPMMIQQGITNLVNLLDNLMVGSLGTAPMSGVAIVNQLFFVYTMTLFGMNSGVSIFGAQFYGSGDFKGMRSATRLKLVCSVVITVAFTLGLIAFGPQLIGLFLHETANDAASMALTMESAVAYLKILLWGFPPFMMVMIYSGTLREAGDTMTAMIAGVVAIVVNLTGNYLLIFGNFGFPEMGAAGAALATVLSRWVEMSILMLYAHKNETKFPFFHDLYKSMHIPMDLCKKVAITGSPLFLNEILWSAGTTFVNQNYSLRGLTAVAASNITQTCWQLFTVVMFAMGGAIAIRVGQQLGAGEIQLAKDTNNKMMFFNLIMHLLVGGLLVMSAPWIPHLYNTEPAVRDLACQMLIVAGAALPIHAYIHGAYFTIRSGGKTIVTFLFDCGFTWVASVPISFVLARYTTLPMAAIYAAVQFADAIKLFAAVPMLRSGFWANNVVKDLAEK